MGLFHNRNELRGTVDGKEVTVILGENGEIRMETHKSLLEKHPFIVTVIASTTIQLCCEIMGIRTPLTILPLVEAGKEILVRLTPVIIKGMIWAGGILVGTSVAATSGLILSKEWKEKKAEGPVVKINGKKL